MSSFPPQPPVGPAWSGGAAGPYGYVPGAVPAVQRLRGLATATSILLGVCAVLALAAAFSAFDRGGKIDALLGSNPPSFSDMDSADDRVALFTGLYGLGLLVTAVVFIVWQHRFAKNAEAIGGRLGLGPGWAIGGWFVPVASLVLPPMQLHQAHRASARGTPAGARVGSGVIVVWAIAWSLASIVFVVGLSMRPSDEEGDLRIESVADVEAAADSDRVAGVGLLGLVVAAGLAIAMVRRLTDHQEASAAALGAGGSAPGAWGGPPGPQPAWGAAPQPAWGTPPQPPAGPWGAPPSAPPSPSAPPPPAVPPPSAPPPADPGGSWLPPPS
ncbi:MAG: DUF4328 domain-containing protein [Acidimicrobiia bacterium]